MKTIFNGNVNYTNLNEEYDVVVCGGGIAGISAALAAARAGSRVLLIEKSYMLGGLATAGLITIYLPLCDGKGHQVSFGIAEELLRLSIKYGAEADYPANWLDNKGTRTENDRRFEVQYNAQTFAILAEKLLMEEKADILYGSYVIDVIKENEKIQAVIVQNKSGRTAYKVKSVVDATGDCDIAKFADAPTDTFQEGNMLAAWYYFTDEKGYKLRQLGIIDVPQRNNENEQKENLVNQKRFDGLDGEDISKMVQSSHQTILKDWLKRRESNPEMVISTLTTIPQIRMTRKLIAEYEISYADSHKFFKDSVGLVSNWKERGPIYEIPFSSLYNKTVKNLIVAGRCISTDQVLWDIMRVIPCCAVSGQAAGTAAAMTDDFTKVDIKALQSKLRENGVALHENELMID